MRYRESLLQAGFSEAERTPGHFFLPVGELTAFVVNLDDEADGVSVLYGFASAAAMAGDEDWFSKHGWDNESCTVRDILFLYDEESETRALETISLFFAQYKDYSKEEILTVKKERQKAFLNRFAPALKSLGFKRKRARWTKDLGNGTALSFEAQKSAFSDQYYFNVIVHDALDLYAYRSYERVVMVNSDIYNWQLMTEKQTEDLISCALTSYILPKLPKEAVKG